MSERSVHMARPWDANLFGFFSPLDSILFFPHWFQVAAMLRVASGRWCKAHGLWGQAGSEKSWSLKRADLSVSNANNHSTHSHYLPCDVGSVLFRLARPPTPHLSNWSISDIPTAIELGGFLIFLRWEWTSYTLLLFSRSFMSMSLWPYGL